MLVVVVRRGRGGGVKKCDLLNAVGGQRGVWCLTSLANALVPLQLKLVLKLLMPVEKRNTASHSQVKVGVKERCNKKMKYLVVVVVGWALITHSGGVLLFFTLKLHKLFWGSLKYFS